MTAREYNALVRREAQNQPLRGINSAFSEIHHLSTIPEEIVIEPNPQLAPTTQQQKENALRVLFVELARANRAGCEVNIDDPHRIIVKRPL